MTATERAAFTRSILDDPADDTRRLAFADWLDENGEPERAEFIRVQVELANHPLPAFPDGRWCHCAGANAGCPWCPWQEAERRLLARENIGKWLGDLPGLEVMTDVQDFDTGDSHHGGWTATNGVGGAFVAVNFSRGFVAEVRLSAAALLGGPCGNCQYWGWDGSRTIEEAHAHCESCRGKKTIPGIAREIFAAHPVTRVIIPEVRAICSARGPGFKCWSLVTHIDFTRIPELRDAFVWHETEAGAIDLFSNALVNYGRSLAGLLPLFTDPPDAPV